MRRAFFAHAQSYGVGGVRLEKVKYVLGEGGAGEPVAQQLGNQNVRNLLDVIAGARVSLHSHAERAQFLHPGPDRGAGNANFFGDLWAADHDGGILRQQCQQGIDALVGRPSKFRQVDIP